MSVVPYIDRHIPESKIKETGKDWDGTPVYEVAINVEEYCAMTRAFLRKWQYLAEPQQKELLSLADDIVEACARAKILATCDSCKNNIDNPDTCKACKVFRVENALGEVSASMSYLKEVLN